MLKIAIYGKGGIGKSTTSSNIAAALSKKGLKVMQIGCDPKSDSTSNLCQGQRIATILDVIKSNKDNIALEDIVKVGYNGVLCVEAGGPTPGIGCAGRGIVTAFEKLEELNAFEIYKPDVVIYDVLGDVVCGGFAMPLRGGYADYVFIVSSGEKMSLYAAYNIAQAIDNFKGRNYAKLAGVILNAKNIENEEQLVQEMTNEIDSKIIHVLPRHSDVQKAEAKKQTVVEAFETSESSMAYEYAILANKVLEYANYE